MKRARKDARQATSMAAVMTESSVNTFGTCQTLKMPGVSGGYRVTVLTDSLLDRTPHIQPCLVQQLFAESADYNHTDDCKNHNEDSKGEDAG